MDRNRKPSQLLIKAAKCDPQLRTVESCPWHAMFHLHIGLYISAGAVLSRVIHSSVKLRTVNRSVARI